MNARNDLGRNVGERKKKKARMGKGGEREEKEKKNEILYFILIKFKFELNSLSWGILQIWTYQLKHVYEFSWHQMRK